MEVVVAPLAVAAPGEFHEFWRPFLDSSKPAVVVLGIQHRPRARGLPLNI